MQINQQADPECEIKCLAPNTPRSRLKYVLYWLVIVLLLFWNLKLINYQCRSTSLTSVNNLLRKNWHFNAFLLPFFCRCWLLVMLILLVKTPLKTQYNHWLRPEFKHLVVRMNQQANPDYYIKSLVPKMPHSRLKHTLYSLVTVMLWCRNMKSMNYDGRSASLTMIKNLLGWNRYFSAWILPLFDMISLIPLIIVWTMKLVTLDELWRLPIIVIITPNNWKHI